MAHSRLLATLGLALAGAAALWFSSLPGAEEAVFQPPSRIDEPAPMCPWREPESDLRRFFPTATGYETEVRVLSGQRLELQRRLGRPPAPGEGSLQVHRVLRDGARAGSVLTGRVKGEHGAIEVVVAFDTSSTVKGVRLQRLREPEAIASALGSPAWLGAFNGKDADAEWRLGGDIPELPAQAHESGAQVVEGVRTLAILLQAADQGLATNHH